MKKKYISQYKFETRREASDGKSGYVTEIPAFNTVIFCDNFEEILDLVEWNIEVAIDDCKKEGLKIPEPDIEEEPISGRVSLRIPKALHRTLKKHAKKEDVSLNQYLLYLLAKDLNHKPLKIEK